MIGGGCGRGRCPGGGVPSGCSDVSPSRSRSRAELRPLHSLFAFGGLRVGCTGGGLLRGGRRCWGIMGADSWFGEIGGTQSGRSRLRRNLVGEAKLPSIDLAERGEAPSPLRGLGDSEDAQSLDLGELMRGEPCGHLPGAFSCSSLFGSLTEAPQKAQNLSSDENSLPHLQKFSSTCSGRVSATLYWLHSLAIPERADTGALGLGFGNRPPVILADAGGEARGLGFGRIKPRLDRVATFSLDRARWPPGPGDT